MYLARVVCGKAEKRGPEGQNSEIKHPPKGYHSIHGDVAPGHYAYMIYVGIGSLDV